MGPLQAGRGNSASSIARIELNSSLSSAHQGLSQALIHAGDLGQAVAVGRRGVELGPSDADALLFLAVALFESGEIGEALELADKAIGLNPVRPAYYCFFHAMILWGNERYQQALDEEEECLRKAPAFGGAHTYRVMCLVGIGHLDEARKLLAQLMASPGGFWSSRRSRPSLPAALWPSCKPQAGVPRLPQNGRRAETRARQPLCTFSEIFSSLSGLEQSQTLGCKHGAGPRLSCPLRWALWKRSVVSGDR